MKSTNYILVFLCALTFNTGLFASISGVTPAPSVRDSLSCDIITMRDGTERKVKVLVIDENTIEYKRCDNTDGPTYKVSKESVFMIKYPDGRKDVFKSSANVNPSSQVSGNTTAKTSPNERAKVDGLGLFALIVIPLTFIIPMPAILGLVFTLLSFIFGLTAPNRIKNSKGRLKGPGWGTAAAIISGLILLIVLVGLLFIR